MLLSPADVNPPTEERSIRISELADVTGIPVATIKYYLREGLVPRGRPTAPNHADYDTSHVQRLRVVRVLREVGGLSIETIRQVIAVIDDPERPLHDVLGAAHRAISPSSSPVAAPDREMAEVDRLLGRLGWDVDPNAPDRRELADALVALRSLGHDVTADSFVPYARAVEPIAADEVAGLPAASRDEAVEYVVVGTVVYGAALAALRRLAQEHHSARRAADRRSLS